MGVHFLIDVDRARAIWSIPISSYIFTQCWGNRGVVKTCDVNIIFIIMTTGIVLSEYINLL